MSRVEAKFRLRTAEVFRTTVDRMHGPIEVMMADLASRGLLDGGETFRRALMIFQAESSRALQGILLETTETNRLPEKHWRAAMAGIESALEEHLAGARKVLPAPIRLAKPERPTSAHPIDRELDQSAKQLRQQLVEFRVNATPTPSPFATGGVLILCVAMLILLAVMGVIAAVAT